MTDELEDEFRRIAYAMVAEAPPAPAFPTNDYSDGHDRASVAVDVIADAAAPTRQTRHRTIWPLAVAATVALLAGIAFLGPWSRSNEDALKSTVATQPETDSPPGNDSTDASSSPASTATPMPAPEAVDLFGEPIPVPEGEASQLHTPGLAEPGLYVVPRRVPRVDLFRVFDGPDEASSGRLLVDINPVTGEETSFPLLTRTAQGEPLVLRVIEGQPGDQFVKVQAPVRPHGQTVWVATRDVTFYQTDVRIEIDLAFPGRLEAWRDDQLVLSSPIGWGRSDQPTARHETYVEQVVPAGRLGSEFESPLLMMASYSEVLEDYQGGLPAQTIRASLSGEVRQATGGGIALPDDTMAELASIDGLLGAPIIIFDSSDLENTREQVRTRPWVPANTVQDTVLWELPTFGYS